MNVIYLNPFAFIGRQKENYFICARTERTLPLTEKEAEFLLSKTQYTVEEFGSALSPETAKQLLDSQCIIPFQFDLNGLNSRTNGYFFQMNALNEYQAAKEKHVFLLGAGALGTHLGWGLCAFGVKRFTILDYDYVEMSNLNRQVLYDISDIGTLKVEALRKHLLAINPNCSIEIVNRKVESQEDLYELFAVNPDLVVRGIDTPTEISHWVFSVCEEMDIPYVSGGTIGTNALIGPTYVPGLTNKHMCVVLNNTPLYSEDAQSERLYGTGVSASFSIGYVASEILIDAVKILIGKPELVRYGGCVEVVDHFASTQKPSKQQNSEGGKKVSGKQLLLLSLLSLVLTGLSAVWGAAAPTIPLCYFMLCTLIAAVWYSEPQQMYRNSLLSGAIAGCSNFALSIVLGRVSFGGGVTDWLTVIGFVPQVIFLFTMMICLHSMLFILVSGLEGLLLQRLSMAYPVVNEGIMKEL